MLILKQAHTCADRLKLHGYWPMPVISQRPVIELEMD